MLIKAFQEIFRSAVDASNSNLQISAIPTVPKREKTAANALKDSKKSSSSTKEKSLFAEDRESSSKKQNQPSSHASSSSSSASDLLFGKQKEISRTKREQESKPYSPEGKRNHIEELPLQPESQLFPPSTPLSSLPVVVDRCKKSKKRRDPKLSASQSVLPFESSSLPSSSSSSLLSNTILTSPRKESGVEEGKLFQDESSNPPSTRRLPSLSPPSSSLKAKKAKSDSSSAPPSSGPDTSLDSANKQEALLSATSLDFSQHSTISQASILRQLDTLPRAAVLSSNYWLTPFFQSEFAGETEVSSENVEHELTRILSKVASLGVAQV